MSMGIDTSLNTTSIMAGLQNMQRQMRSLQMGASPNVEREAQTAQEALPVAVAGQPEPTAYENVGKFSDLLRNAFEEVNNLKNESHAMQQRFDLGDRSITLADVMLASQRSSISFEATVQIRNRMVEAYRSIMQMQI